METKSTRWRPREEEHHARFLQTCKHFNGIQHKRCDAGVCYHDIARPGEQRLPCLPRHSDRDDRPEAPCELKVLQTEADWEAREAQIAASMERHRKAGPVLAEIRKAHKGRSASGEVVCPACETGTLRWAISGYNGHMRGACSTAGCLNWIE